MKKNVIFGVIGGTLLVATAVFAYLKRETVKEVAGEISEELKRRLKKEPSAGIVP